MTTVTLNINFEVNYSGSIEATFKKPTVYLDTLSNCHSYIAQVTNQKYLFVAEDVKSDTMITPENREIKTVNDYVFAKFYQAKTYARKMINNSQLSANEREYELWNLRDEDLEQTTIDDLLEYIQESDDYSVKEIK